jgi:hypothetical protein
MKFSQIISRISGLKRKKNLANADFLAQLCSISFNQKSLQKKYTMKAFKTFLVVLFAVGIVATGCKPEQSVEPKKNVAPEMGLAANDSHDRPTPACMYSVYAPLVDAAGNTQGGDEFEAGIGEYGRVEFVNDPTDFWCLLSMGYYWLAAEGSIWVGQCGDVPLLPDGRVDWENFQWGSSTPLAQFYQWGVPTANINLDANLCACAVVVVEGVQSDFFGNAFNNTILWAKGDRTVGANGFGTTVCPVPCPFISDNECHDIDRASGRNCEEITVVSTNAGSPGSAPFTFTVKNSTRTTTITTITGNMTGTATFTVCPTATSGVESYWVYLGDSRALYVDSLKIDVSVTPTCAPPCAVPTPTTVGDIPADYNCGNTNQGERKVNVCHLPPGNPANRQMICIAVSALPAHVIDFKPANNRCLGHMPGCHIGPCDPCGPNTSDDAIARAAAYKLQYGCRGNY